jgi:phytoene dehydrogenase-like protein
MDYFRMHSHSGKVSSSRIGKLPRNGLVDHVVDLGLCCSVLCHSPNGYLVLNKRRMKMDSYVVVGAGLAGLTAANALADRGHKVTVLEQSERPGGRAITLINRGYWLNLGPHALYRGSHAAKAFREWKIPFHGCPPEVRRDAYFVIGRRRYPLITGLMTLLTTRMLSFGEKIELARLLREITSGQAPSEDSSEAWLHARVRSRNVCDLLSALNRLSTYTAELARLSARAMRVQMRAAFKEGVI